MPHLYIYIRILLQYEQMLCLIWDIAQNIELQSQSGHAAIQAKMFIQ